LAKFKVNCVKFLFDVACYELLKSATVSRSYSKKCKWPVFYEPRCILSNKER